MPRPTAPRPRAASGQAAPASPARAELTIGIATAAWLAAWIIGNLAGSLVVGASGVDTKVQSPTWLLVLTSIALWVPMLVALHLVVERFGTPPFWRDLGLAFRPVDLIGIALGVGCQLGLLRLLYWPLGHLWPHTFGPSRLEESARKLWDAAHGGWIPALAVVVVIGAPLVEELVYRGLLQGTFARRLPAPVALVVVATWFALIHFIPIEAPGLFVFGLVVGACALRTRRLGMSVLTHVAFNATGLVVVALR